MKELEDGIMALAATAAAARSVAKTESLRCDQLELEVKGLRMMLEGDATEIQKKLATTVQELYQAMAALAQMHEHQAMLEREIAMLRKVAPHATSKVPRTADLKKK